MSEHTTLCTAIKHEHLHKALLHEPNLSEAKVEEKLETTKFFWIGSPSRSPQKSRSPSLHSCMTSAESEPEVEVDPLQSKVNEELSRLLKLRLPLEAPSQVPAMIGKPQVSARRVMILYASPLAYRHNGIVPRPLTQIPFEREVDAVRACCTSRDPRVRRRPCVVSAQPLTVTSLMQVIAPASPQHSTSVLHLSAHGVNGDMLMEDGKATGHLFTGDMLRDMLKRRDEACGSLRLVFLNACSLQAVGQVFVQGGIPHVVCCSITLLDSVSHVFLRTFYNHLFRGSTIINAFGAAIMALKSDPVAETRKAADSFCLLPEEDPHDEVLFSGSKPDIASPWSGDWTGLADAATDTDGSDQSFFPESSSTDGETSRGSPSDGEMVRLLPRDVVRRAPAHRRTFHGREVNL